MKNLSSWLKSARGKFVLFFSTAVIILTAVFILFSSVLLNNARARVSEANQAMLRNYAEIIDTQLNNEEVFIVNQYLNRSLYLDLESTSDPLDLYLVSCEIGEELEQNVTSASLAHAVYVFSPSLESPVSRSYRTEEFIPEYSDLEDRIWTVMNHEGEWYLVYRCRIHFSDIVETVPVRQLLDDFHAQTDGFDELVLSENGTSLVPQFSDSLVTGMEKGEDSFSLGGQTYRCDSVNVRSYTLSGLQKDTVYLSVISRIVWMIIPLVVLLGLLALYGFHLIQTSLVRPLNDVETGIEELRKGNLSYQLKKQDVSEFQNIVSMYNSLGSEIEALKIDMYEEELEKNRFELLALQRQLDPHFFINCLNNLKTLHVMGREEEYQEMSEELSAYLRAILSQKTEITVREEIERCANYVRLQKIRYQNRAELEVNIYEELEDLIIPAHLLQTFVENSFKYGFDGDKKLIISIHTEFDEDDHILFIIHDNGRGYDPAFLEKLNSQSPVVRDDRECVGIYNVRQRLRLFYHDDASLKIRNDNGAMAVIRIPDQEVFNEYTDD